MNGFFIVMPKFRAEGFEDLIGKFDKLGHRAEGVCKASLYEGAKIVADAIRASGNEAGVNSEIMDGLYVAPFETGGGVVKTEIGFAGYFTNRNGKSTPRALVAACYESGTSNKTFKKTGFIRKAVSQNRSSAEQAITSKFNEQFDKIMGE